MSYVMKDRKALSFWRSTSQFEVDFILGDEVAIEVKAAEKLQKDHFKGLKALREEGKLKKYYLVSKDPLVRNHDGIHCLPWDVFLRDLWQGEIMAAGPTPTPR